MSSTNIFNRLKNRFRGKSGLYDKSTFHPVREWLLGLLLCSIVICVGGVYAAHTFLQYQNVSTAGGEYIEPVTQYDRSLVEKALAVYTKKESAFAALQEDIISVVPITQEISSTTASSTIQAQNGVETEPESESESATTTDAEAGEAQMAI